MSINLLPWRQIQRKQQRKKRCIRFFIYTGIFIFLSCMFKLFLYEYSRHIQSKIITLNKQISSIILHDPQYRQERLLQKLIYFYHTQKLTKTHNEAIGHILFQIANIIPNSIIFQKIGINKNKILLTGKSNQLTDIHEYINAIQSQKIGQSTKLIDIQTDAKNHSNMQFTIEISRGKTTE